MTELSTLFAVIPIETLETAVAPNPSKTGRNVTQSRGYGVVLELLLSKAADTFNGFDSIMDASPFSLTLTPYMLGDMSSMPIEVDEQQA